MSSDTECFFLEDLPESVTKESLKKHLLTKIKIQNVELLKEDNKIKARVTYLKKDIPDIEVLDELDDSPITGTTAKYKISYKHESTASSVLRNDIKAKDFKEDEEIIYNLPYHEHVLTQFIKRPGDEALKYIDTETIEKQRSVIQRLISKIGSNILSGSGIMNVSLPINIFDERSLLEVFAHQCRLAPHFLEKAGETTNPIDKMKYVTAFAISRIHLSCTQLKPFNPIWGETFQCKIGDTKLYLEHSCHHPPIYHFLHLGQHFKSYGYQEPKASTGANSIYGKTLGFYMVEYKDGVKHLIYPCDLSMNGTLIGERTFAIVGKFYIVDEKNDYIAYIELNPETRSNFKKLFSKKKTFPDNFTGCITRLSQTTYNSKDNTFSLNSNHTPLVKISGDWSTNCLFDDEEYWNIEKFKHYPLKRMSRTLQSDSTLRDDCYYLKKREEENAEKAKVEMEEIQRKDRKLRADWKKKK